MNEILTFITEYLYVYIWLLITTFLNVVAPISGSVVVNPVTAFFTSPQRAIGIGAFVFACTGIHRVYLFRREILSDKKNIEIIKTILPYSIVGAVAGGFLISYLNQKVLAFVIVTVSLYFIYKTVTQLIVNKKTEETPKKHGQIFVSMLSGFLQGSGMPGADMRNNYLRTIISEISVRAVGSVVGIINFLIAGSIIFMHHHLSVRDLIFILSIVPLLLPIQVFGKMFLDKMTDRNAKILAISFSLPGIILLSYKYIL